MGENHTNFVELMMAAHGAAMALDDVTRQDSSQAKAPALDNGKRAYSQLLDYQQTASMTAIENVAVQTAMDMLRARLRFFGEAV
jgi:hypothetical protein